MDSYCILYHNGRRQACPSAGEKSLLRNNLSSAASKNEKRKKEYYRNRTFIKEAAMKRIFAKFQNNF